MTSKKEMRRAKSADYEFSSDEDSSSDDEEQISQLAKINITNGDPGWKTVAPTTQKLKAHPVTTNGMWENNHAHSTNLRKTQHEKRGEPKSPPRRVKSMPVTRKKDRKEQMTTRLSDWKTQEFSEDHEGPGMKDGRVAEKIGNEREQVGWNKPKSDGTADVAKTGPFISVNRKPKATKISEKSYKEVQGMGNRNREVPT